MKSLLMLNKVHDQFTLTDAELEVYTLSSVLRTCGSFLKPLLQFTFGLLAKTLVYNKTPDNYPSKNIIQTWHYSSLFVDSWTRNTFFSTSRNMLMNLFRPLVSFKGFVVLLRNIYTSVS